MDGSEVGHPIKTKLDVLAVSSIHTTQGKDVEANSAGKTIQTSAMSLEKQEESGNAKASPSTVIQNDNHQIKLSKSEKKVLKTLVLVTVGFFICWVGRSSLFFFDAFFRNDRIFDIFDDFVISMAFFNSVINPFIYVITLKEYRHKMFQKLRGN